MIKRLIDGCLSKWWGTSSTLPKIGDKVPYLDKIKNERKIEGFRKELFKVLELVPENEKEEEALKNKLFSQIKLMESELSNYEDSLIDFFIENGYPKVTEDFIDRVKKFDPEMDVYDIFQAIRNVWIMNSIQILYDMEVKLTPSIFAYSMLYPYSDNYLDDSNISTGDKIEFNERFRKWLLGDKVDPINSMEQHIYDLVKMIEGEFDRKEYPEVFHSLLGIHSGQVKSLLQQKEKTMPFEKDIIGITFEKGGASVLADAYLVRGKLNIEEAEFMFSYGVLLQIIDDLQDVEEDLENLHMTIFSQLAEKHDIDPLVNKLMNFIDGFFHSETTFNSDKANKLKRVIEDCSKIMIFEAISKNKKRFSDDYIKEIEGLSIVRLSYLKKVEKKFKKSFSSEDIIRIAKILNKEENC